MRILAVLLAALAALLVTVPAACARTAQRPVRATIAWATHGVPHIQARTWEGLGYGYGYALASQDVCILADSYTTVSGERSRFFGPDARYDFRGNGTTANNLDSDFFYRRIIDRRVVERLLAQAPPNGPRPEVRQIVRGYVEGYNRWLRRTGIDRIPDPACRGKAWVTPITELDAYRRFYQLALLASQGAAIDGIGGAQPPAPAFDAAAPPAATPDQVRMLRELKQRLPLGGVGSNAVALGSAATDNGHGLLLGNPHFPWDGSERFFQSQLRVPGKLDVAGASLMGVPLILIGHTKTLAWSHTVSTAFRFTPFELKLVPGSPTTYLVDGQPRQMSADRVTVMARKPDGSLEPRTRTLWSTVYGPVFTEILGIPLFPWTPAQAYAMGDANADNFRYLNHFFEMDRAKSTGEALGVLERNQGIPWVNTIAADRAGKALYADISVTPNVPDAKARDCSGVLGVVSRQVLGLPVLDGSRSACRWDVDPDAVQPGTFGPSHMPHLFRDDYVTNSNDSYWLSNPRQPLTGFARIIGDEGTERSLRTRSGLTMVAERLRDGGRFTLRGLQEMLFSDRQYAGELLRDDLVKLCRAESVMPGSKGPVDVSQACGVLATWDVRDDLSSRGALLFRRFMSNALALAGGTVGLSQLLFREPFSPSDPVGTPRGLNAASPEVRRALADAVTDLRGAGIPLDAPLRDWQYEQRGDERIPIHGGPGTLGVFNAINVPWDPGRGYPDVPHGSSFIMTVRFTGGSCPQSESILSYSQSASPESPYFADQTRAYSAKRWTPMRFCASQLRRDPNLRVQVLRQGRRPARAVRTQDLSETLTARAAASRPPSTSR